MRTGYSGRLYIILMLSPMRVADVLIIRFFRFVR